MQKIELNKIKNSSLWRWRYAIIFTAYSFIFLTVFILASKFLAKEINRSFGQPTAETASITATLDLAGYERLVAKLKLATGTPETTIATTTIINPEATSTGVLSETASATTTTVNNNPLVEKVAPDQKLTVFIANSTKKSGLANQLKNSLSQRIVAEFKTGNRPPPLKQTIIRHKASASADQVKLIKQIISREYDPITEIAGADSAYDFEIIIGQK